MERGKTVHNFRVWKTRKFVLVHGFVREVERADVMF